MPKWLEKYSKCKWDLYLNMFDVVELVDIEVGDDDYYFKVRWSDWDIFDISCVVGLIKLRDKIDDGAYVRLYSRWQMNVLDNLEE